MTAQNDTPPPNSAPVSLASMTEVNGILAQSSQGLTNDLTKVRVEKWKADGDSKRQSLANLESLQRNLQSALPAMVSQLNAAPDSLGVTFKLYRNIGALYDVLSNLAESAGAFGSKDEYQTLANDATTIEKARRALAERMDDNPKPKKPAKKKVAKPVAPAGAPGAPKAAAPVPPKAQ
jgi:hypothetical protein